MGYSMTTRASSFTFTILIVTHLLCCGYCNAKERPIRNAIILAGSTGEGKSFLGSKIFEINGQKGPFKSSGSSESTTNDFQKESLLIEDKKYVLIDTPGFFDTRADYDQIASDSTRVGQFVRQLLECKELYAIVFVYSGKLHIGHKYWFDKLNEMLVHGGSDNIIVVQNKVESHDQAPIDEEKQVVQRLLGKQVAFVRIYHNSSAEFNGQLRLLLKTITNLPPVRLDNVIVPKICFQEEQGQVYEKATTTIEDRGHLEKQKVTKQVVKTLCERERFLFIPVGKTCRDVLVQEDSLEDVYVPNNVAVITRQKYRDLFMVWFDGRKDLLRTEAVGSSEREEKHDEL